MSGAAVPPSPPPPSQPPGQTTADDTSDELPSEAAIAEARCAADENEKAQNGAATTNGDNIRRYSADFLIHLRSHPFSLRRPECLNKPGYMSYGCWATSKRLSETLGDDDRITKDLPGEKRRPGDPRERLRKESEGIVLSPQRRSFTSGCFVMTGNINSNRLRPDSPIFSQQQDQKNDHGSRDGARRIGSGRIIPRDIAPPWERGGDIGDDSMGGADYNIYRAPGSQRDRGDDRYERRSFGRDLYISGDKNRGDRERDRDIPDNNRYSDRKDRDDMRRNNRYGNERRRGYDKDEEPEWFSGGPTSQNETIELRGFDDPVTSTTTSTTNSTSNSENVTNNSTSNMGDNSTSRVRSNRRSAGSGRTPSAIAANQAKDSPKIDMYKEEIDSQKDRMLAASLAETVIKEDESLNKTSSRVTSDKKKSVADESDLKLDSLLDLNMDDFLKLDLGPGLVSNGGADENYSGGSRFSRWFKRESPPTTQIVPPSAESEQDHGISDHLFNNIMNDLETSITIPNNDSQHVFAPISPAASTTPAHNSLLEILRRGQQQQPQQQQQQYQHQHKPMENMPKIHRLSELEADMCGGPIHQQHQVSQHQQMQRGGGSQHQPHPDDSSAFKRLLAQVFEGQVIPASNGPLPPPMSILQMLSKSQQADQAAMEAHHNHHHQQAQTVSHDLLKLLQVQQPPQPDVKLIQGNVNIPNRHYQISSPIPNDIPPHIGNLQPSRDLLQRPEAQAIIQGLRQGEITPQHLMQQMGNPGLQPRHREVITSILKSYQQQQQSSPRNRLVPPPQPPQQQLRISPLPNAYCVSPIMATSPNTLAVHHPAVPPRIPSPRELQAHTQSIMQTALIKKKLEEQRENYRRRQEQSVPLGVRTTTPAPVVSPTKHPAAIAFTPTSVLRKMTAEKETEHIMPKAVGWGAPPLHAQQAPVPKHARPIVKGNSSGMNIPSYQPPPPQEYPPTYINHHQQQQFTSLQQQQQAASIRSKMGHQSHHQFHAMVMQMHRQQHQQIQNPQQHQQPLQANNRGPMAGTPSANLQQMLVHPHHRNHNDGVSAMGPALSPTSNQLARWFSPELLAQATAGKLPSVNMAQNILSLEELERMQHSEAIVHN